MVTGDSSVVILREVRNSVALLIKLEMPQTMTLIFWTYLPDVIAMNWPNLLARINRTPKTIAMQQFRFPFILWWNKRKGQLDSSSSNICVQHVLTWYRGLYSTVSATCWIERRRHTSPRSSTPLVLMHDLWDREPLASPSFIVAFPPNLILDRFLICSTVADTAFWYPVSRKSAGDRPACLRGWGILVTRYDPTVMKLSRTLQGIEDCGEVCTLQHAFKRRLSIVEIARGATPLERLKRFRTASTLTPSTMASPKLQHENC